jgi:hypothetical protein
MLWFGTELNQLDEVRRRLRPQKVLANPDVRILDDRFCKGVQLRTTAPTNLDFGFEEKIELSRERASGPACSASDSLEIA